MRAIAVSTFCAEPCLVEVPKPDPAGGDVRVKVEYAALNPLDWQTADGALDGVAPHAFPLILGTDFAGRVDMIGSGDNRFRVGDPVFGRVTGPPVGRCGAYGEYVCVPQDSPIALVPRDLPLRTAAALPSAGTTAAQILGSTAVRSGRSLLIIGAAGGVGSFLTQLAAARSIGVVAAVRGDEKRRMGALGAAVTVDTTSGPGALEAAVAGLYPEGVDALVDLVSTHPAEFAAHTALVRDGGVAVTTRGVAAPAGVAWVDFRLTPSGELLDALAAGAVRGELSVPIDIELPLEKAPQALAQNRAGGARGKTVLVI
ncbi:MULTISPECIES: NADP-dependent oxidoreductase [Streptomyces]|uniref:NADP-dependent oxidoreductase n=1 Tax=Streptomyces TaxID=1883 RepID=UPI0006F64A77|nr:MULTISPECIES: NADP-dependent oxidoreductase [unclassified Streptomyces]KQX77768.1 alcohol dehydrogenase [Streptomyces sp. Root1319]KQZ10329.1 alcohol dehydrogenase [Streptomyces sp. Root55]RPK78387.1 Zinc-type alcohol dehydrogenase-like protein [Streptomyces sp. ADI97-07]